ncbi:adenylosuccinate synthase [Vibrio albus]|uniref:Adenylosuccinate synthase n=1 Tax=Vibrio albus TaxID=2200953 RepID=A0A2U3BDM5_9VIBR|nr:adenylosuccinate synthase [Vibrio albus]PWI34873.1 adenylosuccinate synthase [Vibrio albus]
MAKEWTHADLCKKAVGWLKRSYSAGGCGCPNAFSEVQSGSNGGEIVDAIGIKTAEGTETIVVEVKVSRSDFLADRKKPFRVEPEKGMGNYRYYMCPEGLISVDDLPPKWGLLHVGSRGKVTVLSGHKNGQKQDWYFNCNRDAEMGMASLLLAKAGDFEVLNGVNRLNQRLENENIKLRKKLDDLERTSRHEEIIRGLDELSTTIKPIPRAKIL